MGASDPTSDCISRSPKELKQRGLSKWGRQLNSSFQGRKAGHFYLWAGLNELSCLRVVLNPPQPGVVARWESRSAMH